MSTPNPLVPQGTFPDRRQSQFPLAVFMTVAVHVVLLGALLIAGCKRTTDKQAPPPEPTNVFTPPAFEPPVLPPPTPDTNVPSIPPPPPAAFPPVETNVIPPPTPPESAGTEHTIIKGDTFGGLAKKYGVTVRAIQEANPGVNSSRLKIGDKLRIPPAAPKPPTTGADAAPGAASEKVYVVKSGDTLTRIARTHGVTARAIREANNLKTDQIKVNQKLKIPIKALPVPAAPETTSPPVPGILPSPRSPS